MSAVMGDYPSKARNGRLQKAVTNQPVSVAIEAGGREFQLYQSVWCVFTGNCGTELDHGVVAVGYEQEQPTWCEDAASHSSEATLGIL